MRFAAPGAFLLLPLMVIYWYYCRRGRRAIVFSSVGIAPINIRSLRQRFLGAVDLLELLILGLIVGALARPQTGIEKLHEVSRGVAIQMVVDISSSMDLPADSFGKEKRRLEIAKRVFETFIAGQGDGEGRRNDLIGMISFARYADTLCPLTLGHDALLQFVSELEVESRPVEDGTAIGDALTLAAARLSRAHAGSGLGDEKANADYEIKSKVIILLTDGENNCGRHMPMEAAALAQKWGIRIHTIGFGDQPETRMVQTPAGEREISINSADTEVLALVAQATGGVFRRASDAQSLHAVYQEIDAMEKSDIVSIAQMDYGEAFGPMALGALVCLVLQELLAATVLRRLP
jgi:Ca-activated chloride channel family protein